MFGFFTRFSSFSSNHFSESDVILLFIFFITEPYHTCVNHVVLTQSIDGHLVLNYREISAVSTDITVSLHKLISFLLYVYFYKVIQDRVGEMTLQLRTLDALPDDLSSVPAPT